MRTASVTLYPLTFAPRFKSYTWGGRKLGDLLGRHIPDGRVAESWEISAHPSDRTPVLDGPLKGEFLDELLQRYGAALVGHRNRSALENDRFPLLIKLLDAHEWLSVQVHPKDGDGQDEMGKTEMWVVLQADPGAELILGLDSVVDEATLRQAISEERLEQHLHRVTASAGDVFLVPAGTIHALGPGLLLAEIQQSSDTTYRLYDWGRRTDGDQPRPLHVDEGLRVLDFEAIRPGAVTPTVRNERGQTIETLAITPHFRTERLAIPAEGSFSASCDGASFEIWCALSGEARFLHGSGELELKAVSWCLLPADIGDYEVCVDEPATLLRITAPGSS